MAIAVAALTALALATPAPARQTAAGSTAGTEPPASLPQKPADYLIGPRRALRIADTDPTVIGERTRRGKLTAGIDAKPAQNWEVGYFDRGEKVVLVVVDGVSGEILESWTGIQVAWPMAGAGRGSSDTC